MKMFFFSKAKATLSDSQPSTPLFPHPFSQNSNSKAFADKLMALGFDIVSGGTDNHMSLVDLSSKGVSGAKGERICEMVNIVCNKNTVPKDKSPMNPSGMLS